MVENTNGVSEVAVEVNNIDKFIGHPVFKSSKFYGLLPPPVSFNTYYMIYRELLSDWPIMTMVDLFSTSNQHKVHIIMTGKVR
jgi:hypothetical protein